MELEQIKKISKTQKFLQLPVSARELWFQIAVNADETNVVKVSTRIKNSKASCNDLRILIKAGFAVLLDDKSSNMVDCWDVNFVEQDTEIQLVCDGVKPVKKKPQKRVLGEYGHVRLTDEEITRLKSELGDELFDACVNKLDRYMQSTGKPYKDCNLAIRNWVIDAVKKDNSKSSGYNRIASEWDNV